MTTVTHALFFDLTDMSITSEFCKQLLDNFLGEDVFVDNFFAEAFQTTFLQFFCSSREVLLAPKVLLEDL